MSNIRTFNHLFVSLSQSTDEKSPRPNEGYIADVEGYEFVQLMSVEE